MISSRHKGKLGRHEENNEKEYVKKCRGKVVKEQKTASKRKTVRK